MILKPQDIFVLVKLVVSPPKNWSYMNVAYELNMSSSEVHSAIKRTEQARLFDSQRRIPIKQALHEFLVHGIKYAFPASTGGMTRGIPTAFAHEFFNKQIWSASEDIYVWPHPEGYQRGNSLSPLYKSVPDAAMRDEALHQALAAIDAIRVGRKREAKIAEDYLKDLLIGQ